MSEAPSIRVAPRIACEFPDVPIRMTPRSEPVALNLARLGTGTLMSATVNVADPKGFVIGVRVFAHADELPLLDLSTLRHRGRVTTVTEWTPVPPGMLRIGSTLRLALFEGPEMVEIADVLPTYRELA